ncbi:MAG: radical protein [Crocinitomicaceae bacterium]|nr:radical protein [Crocinitomicaceae bacterium]
MKGSVLYDNLRILRLLNPRRCWNLLVLGSSFILSRLFKKNFHRGLPFTLSIEPTTACNLGCPECPSGLKQFTRPTGKIDLASNKRIIEQVGKQLFYINYYFQGEPFLNPDFLELVKEAKKHRIYTATSTNAHFINRDKAREIVNSGLDRLIISIDGTTQETYENYRVHGKLEKVLEASRLLVEAKKELNSPTPHLIFQFLVVKPNEHQVEDVFKLADATGIDEVRLKSAQVYDYEHGNPLIPENEKYARYVRKKDGTFRLKAETGNHCWRMWSSCVLTWDAQVVPCCFDKDATIRLGSVLKEDFKNIWNSKKYANFRQQILGGRNEIEICRNCSEGSKVWV